MKKIVFTEEQIICLKGLLGGITTTGIQNAKQITFMAQILDSGIQGEIKEEPPQKEGGDRG